MYALINRNHNAPQSVLASLRAVVPRRIVTFGEAPRIAELQAARLRELTMNEDAALPEDAIAGLPRIRISRRRLPTSGMSYWNGQEWVIALNSTEPEARQRFTLLHEYKHIVDHGQAERLYRGSERAGPNVQAEHVADYFAGCVLMPKRLVKRAWGQGIQTPERLAERFEVSPRAAEVRLAQLGLTEPIQRCDLAAIRPLRRRRNRYFRASSRYPLTWSRSWPANCSA